MKRLLFAPISPSLDWLVIVRVFVGILIIRHSYILFDATAMLQTAQFFENINIPMPVVMAYMSKAVEFFGGIVLILGLFTRLMSLVLVLNMLIALGTTFQFNIFSGGELPFLYMLVFAVFVGVGGGRFSLDKFLM